MQKQKDGERAVNIQRPNTKCAFVKFSDIDVKAVFDRQPLLCTGPLPDWQRNLVRGRARPMVALDNFADSLCLWRCIAVYQGARTERSTKAAREFAKSYFKLREAPNDVPKTSLDELDKVERHFNQGRSLTDWFGIRAYEPERQENGEIVWHLRQDPPGDFKKIITLGIYEGHAFLIKDIRKLAKIYGRRHCRPRFTQAISLQRNGKTYTKGQKMWCPNAQVKAPQTT